MNEFPGRVAVFHLDLYRLQSARDVESLGLEEYASRGALVVEWGERLPGAWLADALHVAITPGQGDERLLTAAGSGTRGHELLTAWCALSECW